VTARQTRSIELGEAALEAQRRAAVDAKRHEAGLAQHLEVLGDAGLC